MTAGPRRDEFLAALRAGGLVFDGAMGTSLYAKGHLYTQSFDMLASVRDRVAGAYIMPPFGRYELALDVLA